MARPSRQFARGDIYSGSVSYATITDQAGSETAADQAEGPHDPMNCCMLRGGRHHIPEMKIGCESEEPAVPVWLLLPGAGILFRLAIHIGMHGVVWWNISGPPGPRHNPGNIQPGRLPGNWFPDRR